MKTETDRLIALAGIFQAADLVSQIARKGLCDTEPAQASIYSIFQVDAASVSAVYNGIGGVRLGLRTLASQLNGNNPRNMEIIRYVIVLIQLERKLSRQPAMLSRLGSGIAHAKERLQHFNMAHPNILAELAELYRLTLSTLKPTIMVQGEAIHLNNPNNANKIRALLLAGIRSAMLWRQCGGKRWQILLGRKRMLALSQSLAQQAEAELAATASAD